MLIKFAGNNGMSCINKLQKLGDNIMPEQKKKRYMEIVKIGEKYILKNPPTAWYENEEEKKITKNFRAWITGYDPSQKFAVQREWLKWDKDAKGVFLGTSSPVGRIIQVSAKKNKCETKDFVSKYAKSDMFEDFAESFLLYFENSNQFEKLAKKN